ncbi:ComEC/Rec2 family competence protein [Croceibacterium xixiisoli]|nr:ComEC/Rec2 family competence protein [Croceibacterium xixiisoli]
MRHTPWRSRARLSSVGGWINGRADQFLASAGFDRGPWLTVALLAGIATWFVLPDRPSWLLAMAIPLILLCLAWLQWRMRDDRVHLLAAIASVTLLFAFGVALIWSRSEMAGMPPLERTQVMTITGRVLDRIEQPAEGRTRLVLAIRDPQTQRALRVRINVPLEKDSADFREGAVVQLRSRLMPPAPPMVPGAYNFARTAWFQGLAATGNVIGDITLVASSNQGSGLAQWQRSLSDHIRSQLGGSAGAIAAAFASGDRGGIAPEHEEAMRDSGLTHLLSISGLHVSAVIAAAYLLALRLLALLPWLALRVRLPLMAAGLGALTGIFYTLLTGAEVPTIRSCVGAVLVLIALALGREALSLRMVAVGAAFVLLLWPEALAGPSFQMSFAAVIALVALHECQPVRTFLAPREEGWLMRGGRRMAILLLAGIVIEIALMPIVLFHFHRAGAYGAFANVVAIPLVTFISMPLIALALLLDLVGLGGPAWWLVGQSLDLLIAIAEYTANRPGAVRLMPQMDYPTFALFLAGGFWLALWRGKARLLGLVPTAIATVMLLATPVPDLLITGDGRHVAITGEGDRLLLLRDTNSDFTLDNLRELSGAEGEPLPLSAWPGAKCSRDFCVIRFNRAGRDWDVLMGRSRQRIEERALAAACERADIVVSERWLPRSCRPRWLKADRSMLSQSGGLAIVLDGQKITSVADAQGDHGWWLAGLPPPSPRASFTPELQQIHAPIVEHGQGIPQRSRIGPDEAQAP